MKVVDRHELFYQLCSIINIIIIMMYAAKANRTRAAAQEDRHTPSSVTELTPSTEHLNRDW